MTTAFDETTKALTNLGFRKRSGGIYTWPISDDVLGWLGLNRASRHLPTGVVEVTPIVGVRHQEVERVVAEMRDERFHPYLPPTVNLPLRMLIPSVRSERWILDRADPFIGAERLADVAAKFVLPFYHSVSTLPEICDLLDRGIGHEHQLIYRRPTAWQLLGKADHARTLIDSAEEELGDRNDAAAAEFRAFAARFRRRFSLYGG